MSSEGKAVTQEASLEPPRHEALSGGGATALEHPICEENHAIHSSVQQPPAEPSLVEQPPLARPSLEQRSSEPSSAAQLLLQQPSLEQAAAAQSSPDRHSLEQRASEQLATKEPAAAKTTTEDPTTKEPDNPAAQDPEKPEEPGKPVEPEEPDGTENSGPKSELSHLQIDILNALPMHYSEAIHSSRNLLHEVKWRKATFVLYDRLVRRRKIIRELIRHHLGLDDETNFSIPDPDCWPRGSFNVCIPVNVRSHNEEQQFIMRCALPHKLAEAHNPGSIDEKMRSEVGTYVWMQEHCTDIRIPKLYGFGLQDQHQFTHVSRRPLLTRLMCSLGRFINGLLGREPLVSRYVPHQSKYRLPVAYMLLEDVSSSKTETLAKTWIPRYMGKQGDAPSPEEKTDPQNDHREANLFRGISRIMLSLARVPLPRIGSFAFQNDGTVTLTNRPLSCGMIILENHGIPKTIPSNTTYSCVEPFVSDLLSLHEQRFLLDRNLAYRDDICRGEMATRVLLRALSHRYLDRTYRNGPFFLQLNDLHASNLFVDKDWNIDCLIDMEWISSLPANMLHCPYWLTGKGIDQIVDEQSAFEAAQEKFWSIFEEEEAKIKDSKYAFPLTRIMRELWASKATWFFHCLKSVNAMYPIFSDHLRPTYYYDLNPNENSLIMRFMLPYAHRVFEEKLEQFDNHMQAVDELFRREGKPITKSDP